MKHQFWPKSVSARQPPRQVQSLQRMVSQLQEERVALAKEVQGGIVERPTVRQRLSAPHVSEDVIPPMPTLVP